MTENTAQPFAKLFDIDGQQLLFEVLPSEDTDKRAGGTPDVMLTTDLGWTRYQARVTLAITEEGRQKMGDPVAYLLADFTEEKAQAKLAEIQSEWSGAAVLGRMDDEDKEDMSEEDEAQLRDASGGRFASLAEVDGRQVLVVAVKDLGPNEDQEGVVVKVARAEGGPAEEQISGRTLDDVTEDIEQVSQAVVALHTPSRKAPRP